MNVIIFGATGMVGMGALLECIDDARVHSVLVIGRNSCGVQHPKVTEVLHQDFFNFGPLTERFRDKDACFFCLGVSSLGLDEQGYRRLTYDLTLAAAQVIAGVNKRLTFCYVSGTGTDSSERGSSMWARVKGQTENALLRMPFKAAYMFRPGVIQAMRGVKSRTALYRRFYVLLGWLLPLVRRIAPNSITTTVAVGRALIQVSLTGYSKHHLENEDINRLGAA